MLAKTESESLHKRIGLLKGFIQTTNDLKWLHDILSIVAGHPEYGFVELAELEETDSFRQMERELTDAVYDERHKIDQCQRMMFEGEYERELLGGKDLLEAVIEEMARIMCLQPGQNINIFIGEDPDMRSPAQKEADSIVFGKIETGRANRADYVGALELLLEITKTRVDIYHQAYGYSNLFRRVVNQIPPLDKGIPYDASKFYAADHKIKIRDCLSELMEYFPVFASEVKALVAKYPQTKELPQTLALPFLETR